MLVFSVGYFYMLPRLYSESFDGEGLGWGGNRIGFSDQISLQFVGNLLRNESPAFRMSMVNETTTKTYRPNQPPYIRGTVVHRYIDGPGRGFWQPSDRDSSSPKQSNLRDLMSQQDCDSEMLARRDCVRVNVAERSPFGPVVCSIPPYAQVENSPFLTSRRDWRLVDLRGNFSGSNPPKRRYSFLSYAFVGGQESPILEDQSDVYKEKQPESLSSYGSLITTFPASLEILRPEIERILALSPKPLTGKLARALFLENHLASNSQYEYTLSLTGPRDSGIDPIADFLLNKRKGHCQYFASRIGLDAAISRDPHSTCRRLSTKRIQRYRRVLPGLAEPCPRLGRSLLYHRSDTPRGRIDSSRYPHTELVHTRCLAKARPDPTGRWFERWR